MSQTAFLFPGQGAQHVGMGKTIAERFPAARELYRRASEILGYDLAQLCFEGPAEQLNTTVISQPALVMADEPTGSLDSENGSQVMGLLGDLNRELGLTIMLATHDDEAARYAGRIIRLRDGMIERESRNVAVR